MPNPARTAPFTQRVNVDAYYTDGRDLYEILAVSALGSVDLRNARTGATRTAGIDAFRRLLWLAKAPA